MSKYPTFFSNSTQVVRFDGHAANAYIPIGAHTRQDFAVAGNSTLTPPVDAVAFYVSNTGTFRYTLDGTTVPDAGGNVGLNYNNALVNIRPGVGVQFSFAAGGVLNLQWLGSV